MNTNKGFTLVELLIVMAVMVVIFAAIIPSFSSFTKSQYLEQATQQLINDLRSTQSRAQQGVGPSSSTTYCWTLITSASGSNSYTSGPYIGMTSGACNTPGTLTTLILPNSITFKDTNQIIYFNQLTGSLNSSSTGGGFATIVIKVGNDVDNKCINIEPLGNISSATC